MKKNKSKDQTPVQFNNNPFKSLKGYKAAPSGSSKETKTPERQQAKEDETELFLNAVSGVKAINSRGNATMDAKPVSARKPPLERVQDEQQLFLQAMKKIGARLRETEAKPEAEEEQRRSASSRLRQLKRGTLRINEELDLHGYVKDDALLKLEHFILAAYRRGREAVLVITGKGINSPEGPVLQGAVADWLRGKGKGMVVEFAPAPRELGGSGAFVAFLKNS